MTKPMTKTEFDAWVADAWNAAQNNKGVINSIRVRIMCEAYDLADRGDAEGYNSIKVMCSDVLKMLREAEPEQNKAQITHADGCWSWGPAHYECACRELAKAKGWKK